MNGFSAADMSTAAANGFRDGLAAQPAAAPVDGDFDGTSYKRMFIDACEALAEVSRELDCDPEEGGAEPILAAIAKLKASTTSAPSVPVETLRALADRWATDRSYTGSPVDDIRALIEKPTMSTPAAPGIDLDSMVAVAVRAWGEHQANCRFTTLEGSLRKVCEAVIDASPKGGGFPWENFPAYLIDKCEGDTISEEGLQRAVADIAKDPHYAMQATSAEVGECRCRPGRYGCAPDCPSQQPTSHGAGVSDD